MRRLKWYYVAVGFMAAAAANLMLAQLYSNFWLAAIGVGIYGGIIAAVASLLEVSVVVAAIGAALAGLVSPFMTMLYLFVSGKIDLLAYITPEDHLANSILNLIASICVGLVPVAVEYILRHLLGSKRIDKT